MPNGHALAGGEVSGDATSWTEMHTYGVPKHQVILTSYTWKDWVPGVATSSCNSSGITFTHVTNYMTFTATGQA